MHETTGLVAPVSAPEAEGAAAALRQRAAAWQVPLTEAEGTLSLMLWGCRLRLRRDAGALRLEISGRERRLVDTLRDSATALMAEAGLSIAWNQVEAGGLAPGLSLARVVSVTRRSPGFLRLRLEGDDLGRFADAASIHVRLLIPPAGRPPAWPRVAASGRMVWPEGGAAPHRALYTVAAHGRTGRLPWIELDIFRHAHSPTCLWAESRPVGRTVGLLGPGGHGCPDAARIWFFGDEAALPAIARMLAVAPGEAQAMLRTAPADFLIDDPRARRCNDLVAALRGHPELQAPVAGGHVWFAGRVEAARAARAHLLARGWRKQDISCAAYWG